MIKLTITIFPTKMHRYFKELARKIITVELSTYNSEAS